MQFSYPADGKGKVPFRQIMTDTWMDNYTRVWFKNRLKSNYIYLIGACYHEHEFLGSSNDDDDYNSSFIYVEQIKKDYRDDESIVNADAVAHELGHQWGLTGVNDNHQDVWCHEGDDTDLCVMDYNCNRTDDYSEFCVAGDDHIHDIRHANDGI